tara:strand:- start:287 stop:439 length:153 start_codon:yes stop_codon:yes gene_type:complete
MNERLEDYEIDYLIDVVKKDLSELTFDKNKNSIIIRRFLYNLLEKLKTQK